MKKVLFSVLAFTIILASCKKYDNEFKDLRAQIAALATQIQGVNSLVTGLSGTTATLAQLITATSGIPALTTGLQTLTTTVGQIQTNLGLVAGNVNTLTQNLGLLKDLVISNQQATASLVSNLQIALQNAITNNNVTLAAIIQQQITIATGLNAQAITAALDLSNLNNASQTDALTLLIAALNLQLQVANANIQTLLASNDFYNDNLTINSEASLAFAESLGSKVKIINGFLDINTTGFTAGQMTRLKQVTNGTQTAPATAWIGTVTGTVTLAGTSGNPVDLSKLTSVSGAFASSGAAHNLSALLTAGNTYSVTGVDILDNALLTVGGAVTLNYDGPYSQPNLASAASLALTHYVTTGTTIVGNTVVDFSGLTVTTPVTVATTFASATSVSIKNAYSDVIANNASTVNMSAANYVAGLTVSATKAGSVITIAGRVDNGATIPVGQALSVTGSATSVLNAAAVTRVAALTVTALTVDFTALTTATGTVGLTSTTPVAFPALVSSTGTITAATATSFSAPKLVASAALTLTAAKVVSLASSDITNLPAGAIENLTFSALAVSYSTASTALKTVNVTGKVIVGAGGSFISSAAVVNLATATFAGELDAVSITQGGTTGDKLTSLTTTGAIDAFTLDNSDIITTGLSLGHSHIAGGAGSVLVITNNAKLASLTSSTNFGLTVTVHNNALLASINLSSYTSILSSGNIVWEFHHNGTVGTYADAVAATVSPTTSTAYIQTIIGSVDIMTFKAHLTAIGAAISGPAPTSSATLAFNLGIGNVGTIGTPVALVTRLDADAARNWAHTNGHFINTAAKLALVQ